MNVRLAADLHTRGRLDLSETFIDGSFASAKKKGGASARRSGARGPRSWPLQTALVFLSPLPSPQPRLMRPIVLALLAQESDLEVVATAASGSEAVDAVLRLAPDLVFLDVQMPELDGIAVVERVGPARMPATIFVRRIRRASLRTTRGRLPLEALRPDTPAEGARSRAMAHGSRPRRSPCRAAAGGGR